MILLLLSDLITVICFYLLLRPFVGVNIQWVDKSTFFFLLLWICSTVLTYLDEWGKIQYLPYIDVLIVFLFIYQLVHLSFQCNTDIKLNETDKIKYYHQKDKRWTKMKYGKKTMGECGCIPTVMAMIHSVHNPQITPIDTGKWAVEHQFVKDRGTSIDFYIQYSKEHGFRSDYISRDSVDEVIQALKSKQFVCILEQYRSGSHTILAYGIDSKNRLLIADPGNYARSTRPIKLAKVLKRVNKLAQQETPFIFIEMNR